MFDGMPVTVPVTVAWLPLLHGEADAISRVEPGLCRLLRLAEPMTSSVTHAWLDAQGLLVKSAWSRNPVAFSTAMHAGFPDAPSTKSGVVHWWLPGTAPPTSHVSAAFGAATPARAPSRAAVSSDTCVYAISP